MAAIALAPTVLLLLLTKNSTAAPLVTALFAAISFGVVFLLIPEWATRRAGGASPCRYELGPQGLRYATANATMEYPWSAFKKAHRRRRFYWLTVLEGPTFGIPVRALDGAQQPILEELLRTRVAEVKLR